MCLSVAFVCLLVCVAVLCLSPSFFEMHLQFVGSLRVSFFVFSLLLLLFFCVRIAICVCLVRRRCCSVCSRVALVAPPSLSSPGCPCCRPSFLSVLWRCLPILSLVLSLSLVRSLSRPISLSTAERLPLRLAFVRVIL